MNRHTRQANFGPHVTPRREVRYTLGGTMGRSNVELATEVARRIDGATVSTKRFGIHIVKAGDATVTLRDDTPNVMVQGKLTGRTVRLLGDVGADALRIMTAIGEVAP